MRAEPVARRALRILALACLAILLSAFLQNGAQAQSNPFGAPGQSEASPQDPAAGSPASSPSLWTGFWNWVQTTQATLHRQLAGAVRRLKDEQGLPAAWLLISLSFVYGVVHAIGPGHGKAVISSYVLANERTARRGILLSFLASAVQALSAIVIIGVLAIAMNAAGIRIRETAASLETGSYALIALIGAWLLIGQLRPGGGHHHHAHDHGEDAGCGHNHMPDPRALEGDWDLRRMAAIVFAVGVRPCSGALIVLVFALAQGIFWAGVAATFAMAFGTAITVSALAVLAVGSKQLALRFAGPDSRWTEWIYRGTAIGGSALVLLLGVVLFIGSLGPARPF